MTSMVGGVVSGVLSAAESYYQGKDIKKMYKKQLASYEAKYNQQMAAYNESQAKIWDAYNQEVSRQAGARNEYLEGQRERWEPYIASQKEALAAYQKAAYQPEISDYAKLRMEESEKAINKELAKRGILFSGAASELREKSRRTITAEETEKAKAMLEKLATGIAPVEPGFIAPAQVSIPGGVGMPGFSGAPSIPGAGASSSTGGGGISGATNAVMAGLYGYQRAQGYQQQMVDLYGKNDVTYGLNYNSATGLYQ